MDEGWIPVRVVLGQGKGGTGDRFSDAAGQGKALHEGGFAGTQFSLEQQDASPGQLFCQVLPQSLGRLKGLKLPDTLCKVRTERARSLGVSAEIHLHVSQ